MGVSYKQRAYDHIRDKLMVGELAAGCRLSNRALAREIGISIIPVREAISQLVSEGLLEHKPRVGTFVVEPSRQEIAELCELREALEAYAASRAAERISDGELAEMQRCCDAMDVILEEVAQSGWDSARSDRWRLADAGFHLALLRAAGNRRTLKTVSDLRVMTYVFGHRDDARSLGDPVRACKEHQQILEAVRRRDPVGAREVMSMHLSRAEKIVLEVYEKSRMATPSAHSPSAAFSRVLRERIHKLEQEPDGVGESS